MTHVYEPGRPVDENTFVAVKPGIYMTIEDAAGLAFDQSIFGNGYIKLIDESEPGLYMRVPAKYIAEGRLNGEDV